MTERSTFLWPLSLAIVGAVASPVLPSCSSSSNGSGFGGDDASSPSGSSSGSGDDGAAGSSSGSPSGSSSGSSSGAKDGGASGTYVPAMCGTPCDLRSNTCCLPADGGPDAAYCIKGSGSTCGTEVATLHCGSKDDCSNGDLCCGDYDLSTLTAETVCQSGACALAQFCKTSDECPSGVQCTAQSCSLGANVHLCGLKSGPPYNCVMQ